MLSIIELIFLLLRSFSSLFAGFSSILFLEGFIRIVISVYHKSEYAFFGISRLPGTEWVVILYVSVLLISWLSGMIVLTLSRQSPLKHMLALWVIMIVWRINEYHQTSQTEPFWYLATITLMNLTGFSIAYFTSANASEKT